MTSRLAQMQAKFQQKQIQEREEKLLRLYESQQQKTFERVGGRGSAGSNTSLGSTGGGKVRQMFDERRQKAGIDRSYPLEPLKATNPRGGSKITVKATKNAKPEVSKKIVHSIYNNNDGDESFEQHTFQSNNLLLNQTFNKHSDIVEMMNNHNLSDCLDNEQMPDLGFDEVDESVFPRKLANLGGKLPSEKVEKKASKPPGNTLGKTFRKETKPIIKRSVKASASVPSQQPPKSLISSPVRSQSMQSAKSNPVKKGTPQPPQSARAPCKDRPSAKQSGKSPVARDDLNECRFCNRRFAADRLEVHESICGKTAKKKRKIYDATKHRVEGTELEQYVRKGHKNLSSKSSRQAPKKDWRRTHEEFINAIRAAKMAQAHVAKGGKLADLPPPPPSSNPDYVQCPHCGRKFNEAAAERHIPKCATYEFNKPKPGANRSKTSGRNMR
ncbi:zinc finger C2HC domain-containing protein 1C isoform X2 [Tribolium madens]|uniref:zinc finger C2HC domain-containing protein 1C isoform X2 n=1 Tax=Tribolium madens TaxID=41895 RepID=UPI001CF7225D|nr:zinc finger C2HC domain-containing protein 1C isoform X2 [Tribolium madens]